MIKKVTNDEDELSSKELKMAEEIIEEHWMTRRWKPLMAWVYGIICLFDFILAPILWTIIHVIEQKSVGQQWTPLTLQSTGLFHISMGAILGVAAINKRPND